MKLKSALRINKYKLINDLEGYTSYTNPIARFSIKNPVNKRKFHIYVHSQAISIIYNDPDNDDQSIIRGLKLASIKKEIEAMDDEVSITKYIDEFARTIIFENKILYAELDTIKVDYDLTDDLRVPNIMSYNELINVIGSCILESQDVYLDEDKKKK